MLPIINVLRSVPDVVPVNTIEDYFSPKNMAKIFTEYLSELGANFDLDLIKKEKIKEQHNWYKDNQDKGEGDL